MLDHPAVKMTPQRRRLHAVLAHEHRRHWWCTYCGIPLVPLGTLAAVGATVATRTGVIVEAEGYAWPSIDHKLPRTRGGTDDLDNLTVCCLPCNTRKGARTYDEFMDLLSAEADALLAEDPDAFAVPVRR